MSRREIRLLKEHDINPEELKDYRAGLDLFKDHDGNVHVKPRDGSGPGEPTGISLKRLE